MRFYFCDAYSQAVFHEVDIVKHIHEVLDRFVELVTDGVLRSHEYDFEFLALCEDLLETKLVDDFEDDSLGIFEAWDVNDHLVLTDLALEWNSCLRLIVVCPDVRLLGAHFLPDFVLTDVVVINGYKIHFQE